MITIAEHSVDLDLLPKKAVILDLGCFGFAFAEEMDRRGYHVYCVDIQDLDDGVYDKVAITNYDGYGYIIPSRDKQAFKFSRSANGNSGYKKIKCQTLKSYCEDIERKFFDLIKIDVEGAEYEIIMSLTEAPAKQISWEAHLHTGIYTMNEVDQMVGKLYDLGYYPAKHELTKQHGAGLNFWDSLWILK